MLTPYLVAENYRKLSTLFPNAVTETITGYDDNGKAIVVHAIDTDVLRRFMLSDTINLGKYIAWMQKSKKGEK